RSNIARGDIVEEDVAMELNGLAQGINEPEGPGVLIQVDGPIDVTAKVGTVHVRTVRSQGGRVANDVAQDVLITGGPDLFIGRRKHDRIETLEGDRKIRGQNDGLHIEIAPAQGGKVGGLVLIVGGNLVGLVFQVEGFGEIEDHGALKTAEGPCSR